MTPPIESAAAEDLAVKTVQCLAMDAVERAQSGHPGMPMGCADFAVVLWLKFLRHSASNPKWPDRDRFVLSAGHGSMLLYAMLHLCGYQGMTLEELKHFRQWGSRAAGHPENILHPAIECTTGPLGQGTANSVGMAIAEQWLAAQFNIEGEAPLVDHFTYALVSDGDLMEGISHEAASLAGHLGLAKLIWFYDSNRITIEGSTDLAYSDNVRRRFEGYHWHVLECDGHNRADIQRALREAVAPKDEPKPVLIIGRTHIGKGSPKKQDTASAHGEPLGPEEVAATKRNIGWPENEPFFVPDEVRALFAARRRELEKIEKQWNERLTEYHRAHPEKAALWDAFHARHIPADLEKSLPQFPAGKAAATRNASGEVLAAIFPKVLNLIGGSADLAGSTKTYVKGAGSISKKDFKARNFHFGVREHAMGGVLNGIALHGGLIGYGGTFLIFSDYMRPSMRLAALSKLPVIYVFTHDSIFLGEDGPTHQPIEHLASLRAIPNLTVIRPADANETAYAWLAALQNRHGPTALVLTRQNVPTLDRAALAPASRLLRGGYVLGEFGKGAGQPDLILIASGSEVALALEAAQLLAAKGWKIRIVNLASWELFENEPADYRESVLPASVTRRLAVEAAAPFGWSRYIGPQGRVHGISRFGASAPAAVLAEKFGFTAAAVAGIAEQMLK